MEPQIRRRRRPALSCLQCRRRKIKCDRNDPCGHCISAKSQCTFDHNGPVAGPVAHRPPEPAISWNLTPNPSSFGPSPLTHVQGVGTNVPTRVEYENHSPEQYAGVTGSGQGHTSNINTVSQVRSLNNEQDSQPVIQDLVRRVQRLEEASASGSNLGPAKTSGDVLGLQDSQIILNKTRMIKWSHWMSTGHELELIIGCYTAACGQVDGVLFQDADSKVLVLEIGNLLQKCKALARSIKMGRPSKCLSCLDFYFVAPPREVSDAMTNLYFQSFESMHRILHTSTFWAEYRSYWDNPASTTTDLRLKILLVIAIGSSLSTHGDTDSEFRDMVPQWIHAAQMWLSGPLKKDRLEIAGIQIHCLTILARQIFSIGGDLVWMSIGSLIHKAMQMGLHRDPKYLPPMSILQAELRRRLWASILDMAVQSSLDSAMPPRISLDEFDTEAPSNNNDEEIEKSATTLHPHPRTTYTSASMQLLLLDSLPIRLQILQLLNGLGSSLSYLDVLSLSTQLTASYQSASTFLSANEKHGVSPFHRNLFHYLIHRFTIPLHCPFAINARTNKLFNYSLQISVDAAMALVSPKQEEAFERLMLIGGGMFKEGIRLAMTVISMELIALTTSQNVDGTLNRNSQQIEALKKAVRDQIELSLQRIRRGETNIKSHMLLSMILAQAEAVEEGKGCEIEVARSARDSLRLCCGLLETRIGNGEAVEVMEKDGMEVGWGDDMDDFDVDFNMDFFFPDASLA